MAHEADTAAPHWSWNEGAVNEHEDHLLLTYAPTDLAVALVAPPVDGAFPVRFIAAHDAETKAWDAVRRELDFYLLEVGGDDPWGYAIYHCGTMANVYSDVRWSWHPAAGAEEAPK
jgi:hypothetical protein